MATITPTIELARAVGMDAGNASMRRGGRTKWNEEDASAFSRAYNAIWDLIYPEAAAYIKAADAELKAADA